MGEFHQRRRAGSDGAVIVARHRVRGLCAGDDATAGQPEPCEPRVRLSGFIHVDAGGTAHLLKEVVALWVPSSGAEAAGRHVLLSDLERLDEYSDSLETGVRYATAAIDYPGTELALTGRAIMGETLRGRITLHPDFATNPFRHQNHPDHDNRDANYETIADEGAPAEVYTIRRDLDFQIEDADAETASGLYHETIHGLHHQPIDIGGRFRLERIKTTDVLNR